MICMERIIRLSSAVLFVTVCLLVGGVVLSGNGHTLWTAADRNYQMFRVSGAAVKAVQADGFVEFTPELAVLNQEMALRAARDTGLDHPVLVTLSLWANDLLQAQHWLQTSPVAQKRVMDSKFGWRTLSLIPLAMRPSTYSHHMIVDMAWLAGLRFAEEGVHAEALQWFRRGLSLAPGRVPEYVRRAYYRTLSKWYAAQPTAPHNSRLAAKFACLANGASDCLRLIVAESPAQDVPSWVAPTSDTGALLSYDGWQLTGFDLDEDILAAGVDVVGVLYWQRDEGEREERRKQPFIAANLVPNPGFEFQDLFLDSCTDGYIGSNAFVEPCVSSFVADSSGKNYWTISTRCQHRLYATL